MKKLLDVLILVAIIVLGIIITCGFLYPDPYTLQKGHIFEVISTVLPIISTVIFTLFALAWIFRRQISWSIPALAFFSLIFSVWLAFPIAQYFYDRSFTTQLSKYHPYLQLKPNIPQKRTDSEDDLVILCLGGSTTEFADEKGGWPKRLEARLNSKLTSTNAVTSQSKQVVVYNAGRQWYTSQHTLINYILNLRDLKPDIILFMHAINDLLINADFSYMSRGEFRSDYGHFLGASSRIINRKPMLTFISETLQGFWNHTPRELLDINAFQGLSAYRRNVETLIELAKNDQAELVLMSEASLFKETMSKEELSALHLINYESIGVAKQWSLLSATNGMRAYNSVLYEIAQKNQLRFIDLDKVVAKNLENFYDEVHFRSKTYDLVAEQIAAELLKTERNPYINFDN